MVLAKRAYGFVLLLGVLNPAWYILVHHPYQMTYFNMFAGPKDKLAHHHGAIDHWDLSYKQTIEWILKNDPRPKIKVNSHGISSIEHTLVYLSNKGSERLKFEESIEKADYYWDVSPTGPKDKLIHTLRAGKIEFMFLYKLR